MRTQRILRTVTGAAVAAVIAAGFTAPVPAAQAAPAVNSNLVGEYNAHKSAIGSPTAAATVRADGVIVQPFTRADMYFTPGLGSGWVADTTRTVYNQAGGVDKLGAPIWFEQCTGSLCRLYTSGGDLYRAGTTWTAALSTETPRLTGVVDFRDLAGEGAGPKVGRNNLLRRGQIYRSGNLTAATTLDKWVLRQLGITDIYDLRTTAQQTAKPTPAITGISVHKINLTGDKFTTLPWTDQASANKSMADQWGRYVTDPAVRTATANLVKQVAAKDSPVLLLDDDGTSRTGYTSALLGLLAGETLADTSAGYGRSNSYNTDSVNKQAAQYTATKGAGWAAGWRQTVTANSAYLNATIGKVSVGYGSFAKFATSGLALTSSTMDKLRTKLLSHSSADDTLRVVEANVLYSLSDSQTMHDVEMAAADADVVGLMEVAEKWSMLERWARTNGFVHIQDRRGSHGRGLLIRRSAITSVLSAGTQFMYKELATSERTLVWATVQTRGGNTVTVAVTHAFNQIDAGGKPNSDNPGPVAGAVTHFQNVKVWAAAKQKSGDVVVVGDMNVNYRKDTTVRYSGFPYSSIEDKGSATVAGLRSNWTLKGLPPSTKDTTHKGSNRLIDYQYVWVGKGHKLYLDSYRIVAGTFSDHLQVHATYHFGPARTGP